MFTMGCSYFFFTSAWRISTKTIFIIISQMMFITWIECLTGSLKDPWDGCGGKIGMKHRYRFCWVCYNWQFGGWLLRSNRTFGSSARPASCPRAASAVPAAFPKLLHLSTSMHLGSMSVINVISKTVCVLF